MLNKWKVLPLVALCLLFPFHSFADELFSVKGGYQLLSPEGSLAGTVNGVGDKIHVKKDLKLNDSESMSGELALQWGDTRLSFNYLPIDFSGTGTLTDNWEFNGQPFSVDDTVKTNLGIDFYDLGYTYYFINLDDLPTRLQLGVEMALKVADIDVTFKDLTQNFVETESAIVAIPTIGARARIALADFLGLTGRIGYLEYDDNHFLDAEAQLEFSPLPMVGLYAGIRFFDLKVDEDDIYVETEFSGPVGGLMVRF